MDGGVADVEEIKKGIEIFKEESTGVEEDVACLDEFNEESTVVKEFTEHANVEN